MKFFLSLAALLLAVTASPIAENLTSRQSCAKIGQACATVDRGERVCACSGQAQVRVKGTPAWCARYMKQVLTFLQLVCNGAEFVKLNDNPC